MKLYLYTILILILVMINHGSCDSTIHVGHRVSLAIPLEYNDGFIGRAFLMDYGDDTKQIEPSFRVALSTEANKGKYSCSLEVFLGDVKVWNSGHYSKFYTSDVCFLELTEDGDLQLKGPKNRIGWRTGTSGQGVERLQILRTGNLVLLDVLNQIKWQSFNFPTDVMLWGQRLDVSTWLTSFPRNTSSFYTFEILYNKVALFLNSGRLKYSYWEFKPSKNRNITFVELGSKGLELFDDKHKKMAQIIASWKVQPVRFLALGNRTGNLGIYFYSPTTRKFEASFQALNTTCDLPLACKPYGICTFSNSCSCIRLLTKKNHEVSDCNQRVPSRFCGGGTTQVEMLELNDVVTVLKDAPKRINVTKTTCANLCLNDCKCVAALHSYGDYGDPSSEQCSLFQLVAGIKQVEKGLGLSYMVKVPKGTSYHHNNPSVKKWVLIVVGVVDGLIIILVLGGLVYYLVHKRRNNLQGHQTLRKAPLDWPTRLNIVKGVTTGLEYLYNELPALISPHGHLKSSNVLLNESLQPLLTDYSLIPLINPESAQELIVAYKSPEYIKHGRITKKTDVWCLGVLILEILTGKFPANFLQKGKGTEEQDLAVWVTSIVGDYENNNPEIMLKIEEVLDKDMGGVNNGDKETMVELLKIGLNCCESDLEKRLDLKDVVERIDGLMKGKKAHGIDDDVSSHATN